MPRPKALNGGRKPIYVRHALNQLMDLRAVRMEIEDIEAKIARLTARRDQKQVALDVLLGQMQRDGQSHEANVSGQAHALCRAYHAREFTVKELEDLAARKIAAERELSPYPAA